VEDFETIRRELKLFSPAVFAKPQITAANKIDALDEPARLKALEVHLKRKKLPLLKISGATGEGVDRLLEAVWKAIARVPETTASAREAGASAAAKTSADRSDPANPHTPSDGVDLLTPARTRHRRP